MSVEKPVTINRSPEEVCRFGHNFANLSRFMGTSRVCQGIGQPTSHCAAAILGGMTLEGDAEMIEEVPNERISWQSFPTAEVQTGSRSYAI